MEALSTLHQSSRPAFGVRLCGRAFPILSNSATGKMMMRLVFLLSALSKVLAAPAPAVVTVTEHAHASAVVTVRGIIYVENGQTLTTYTTIGGATTTAAASTPVVAVGGLVTDEADVFLNNAATTAPITTTTTPAATAPTTTTTTPAAAAATTTATAAAGSTSSSFASTILQAHNNKRSLHQNTPSLSWSDELAAYAQNYADAYDCSGTLTHSGGPYGENLALGFSATGAVDSWYNEIQYYDFSNPGFSSSTGHFTQVVWKSSIQVGCGIKNCNNEWGNYIVCSYNPAGNFIGQFAENVEPLAS